MPISYYFSDMCGRFTLTLEHQALLLRYGFSPFDFEWSPSYNIAPTQEAPIVYRQNGERKIERMRWGLVPSWAKDEKVGAKMINARSETVAEKPSFRRSFKQKRCLVPATGYYEWKVLPESTPLKRVKAPMYFSVRGGEPFSFAGLWDSWHRFDGKHVLSFTIITTEPNKLAESVHNRMPVILRPDDEDTWIDPGNEDMERLLSLLRPYPADDLAVHEVSKLVNSPRNNSPQCIEPVP